MVNKVLKRQLIQVSEAEPSYASQVGHAAPSEADRCS
jgi:hypothetical protein